MNMSSSGKGKRNLDESSETGSEQYSVTVPNNAVSQSCVNVNSP